MFEGIKFGEVRLGHWAYCRYDLFHFRFYSSIFICLTFMHSIQDMATIAIDRYDILYTGDKSDAGVDVIFKSIWILLLHIIVKRAGNSTVSCLTCMCSSHDKAITHFDRYDIL
jgi:hypothetical protein